MKTFLFPFLFLVCGSAMMAGDTIMTQPSHDGRVTGDLRLDLFGVHDFTKGPSLQDVTVEPAPPKKSPWMAAGMSLLVPGSGEVYAESYVKGIAFFVSAVAAWTTAYVYDGKGDDQTVYYEGYADQHWDVVRYGQYAETHLLPAGQSYSWLIPGTEGLKPWERINWEQLNAMERAIGGTAAGRYYSHTLPRYGEQQYYELIGKYPQFNQGWDDAPPVYVYDEKNLTANFQYYSGERGKANDYYETARTAVTIAFVVHILSAVDAAWTASDFNKVNASVGMLSRPYGAGSRKLPALRLSYGF